VKGNKKHKLVGASGFEPETSCAQGRRATRLRYAPTFAEHQFYFNFGFSTLRRCTGDSRSAQKARPSETSIRCLMVWNISHFQRKGFRLRASMPSPGRLFVKPGCQPEKVPTNNGCVHSVHSHWFSSGPRAYSLLLVRYLAYLEDFAGGRFTHKSLPARFRKPINR
jgi:hypothetical protein